MTAATAGATRLLSGGTVPRGPRTSRTDPPGERPTWAEVDLDAIARNVARLDRRAGSAAVMAVVKADGYGHGLVPAARAALRGGAAWLAVALVEEGAALRRAGVAAPVLLLTEPPVAAIPALLAAQLTPTVYSPAFVDALESAVAGAGPGGLPVHLVLDTGMRRVGVPGAGWEDAFRRLARSAALRLQGVMSHFACADEPAHPSVTAQSEAFARGLAVGRGTGARWELAHLSNSAAALTRLEDAHDLVRTGVAIYGLDPGEGLLAGTGLEAALAWYSRLSLTKRVAAGESVGYGHRWTALRETTVGTVPVGYADGVTRALTNRGRFLVGDRPAPIAGTVSMDSVLLDLGDADAASGDEVVLLGGRGPAAVTASDWARLLGTITYEVTCGIGARVPRTYVGQGA